MSSDEALELVLRLVRAIVGEEMDMSADTPLFETAGMDSIGFADLIERLEAAVGPLPDEALVPASFSTPARIASTLLSHVPGGTR
jgi:acyl carrier protein